MLRQEVGLGHGDELDAKHCAAEAVVFLRASCSGAGANERGAELREAQARGVRRCGGPRARSRAPRGWSRRTGQALSPAGRRRHARRRGGRGSPPGAASRHRGRTAPRLRTPRRTRAPTTTKWVAIPSLQKKAAPPPTDACTMKAEPPPSSAATKLGICTCAFSAGVKRGFGSKVDSSKESSSSRYWCRSSTERRQEEIRYHKA